MSKTITTLADLTQDDRNANAGTARGREMVERSLHKLGAGRSILVDRNGKIIAGNKTHEAAAAIGLDAPLVVQSDGTRLVVVQRTDLDMDEDTAARELAIADNRAAETGLEWDTSVLASLGESIDLSQFWTHTEIETLFGDVPEDEWSDALGGLPTGDKAPFQQMTFTVSDEQAEQVKRALGAARHMGPFVDSGNENGNGNALARVCEVFLGQC
jgi:hypothetical protein